MKWKIIQIIGIALMVFGLPLSSERLATDMGMPKWLFSIIGNFKLFILGLIISGLASRMDKKEKNK